MEETWANEPVPADGTDAGGVAGPGSGPVPTCAGSPAQVGTVADVGSLAQVGSPADVGTGVEAGSAADVGTVVEAGSAVGSGLPAGAGSLERAGVDLHLDLRTTAHGVRAGLISALRDAVRTGRLAPGTRLPSSRSLAADLRLARNTVAGAYAELVAEGWLTARQGSGTRVAQRPEPARPAHAARRAALALPARHAHPARHVRPAPQPVHELVPGRPDAASFPRTAWLTAARRALMRAPNEAFGFGDPRGRTELRQVLAGYLARTRGVLADPERIVVCSGFAHGLRLLSAALRETGVREMAVESYGLGFHRDVITRSGLRTTPVAVDERGARTEDLAALSGAGAVLLTAAHQFPTGVPLHPDRRAAAVAWARRTGALVVEDDYDGEFRYDRQPVGALQGLEPDHVVHAGSVSKSLTPGLRLGWLVLPADLVDPVVELKGPVEWQVGTLDQLTLAEFIDSGAYDRHVRGMRLRYRRRRDQLVGALAERAPHIRVTGIAAGLHAVLELPPGTEQAVVQGAARQGLALQGLSWFRHPDTEPGALSDALVVGYGTPPDHAFANAVDALCRALP
ncbi:MocR-like pyridoxine biosynthesis transcription factor PdxR [Streptomyces sp. 8N706]|uniref:MocR-like pyridoxine biosynthesis transcription factor PdxR n=1 Tax=Streptomyces sp. 8N706 TaxID=3457416 RepID=UPI003FD4D3AC